MHVYCACAWMKYDFININVLHDNRKSVTGEDCVFDLRVTPRAAGGTSYDMYVLRFDNKFIAMHLYAVVHRGTLRTRSSCRRYTIVPLTSTFTSRHRPSHRSIFMPSVQYNLPVLYYPTLKRKNKTRQSAFRIILVFLNVEQVMRIMRVCYFSCEF